MTRRWWLLLALLAAPAARAHLGSPDVFYEGPIGPYPVLVTIQMPNVVPGRAAISVEVMTNEPVAVEFRPLYLRSAISNAPPPDTGVEVAGESNLYTGDLWLMTFGAYSIDISVRGRLGHGSVQIPVNSVAIHQLPMPSYLGDLLAVLAVILFAGGVAIIAAAAAEGTLPQGESLSRQRRRKWWIAAAVTTVVFGSILYGGKKWWDGDERRFREQLRDGGWPDLQGEVRTDGTERVLALTIGQKVFEPDTPLKLAPDHGKLLHFFLIREPAHDAFAHIHPVRKGNLNFEAVLPPLPQGDYEMLCDLTLESGVSSTATNRVHLPAPGGAVSSPSDPDDSWTTGEAVKSRDDADTIYPLDNGLQMIWKAHPRMRVNHDARLNFEVRDAHGQPAALEPYMGMLTHVAVFRADDRVFAHLHPTGNYSMAAQTIFDIKMDSETGGANDNMSMGQTMHSQHSAPGTISVPYQFPQPGAYRIWVQVKISGKVLTGVYETSVD